MIPTFTTQRLTMRQFSLNDAESFYRNYAADENNHKYYAMPVYSLAKVRSLIEYWNFRQNRGNEARWAIENNLDHEVIGIIALYFDEQSLSGEVCFGIGKQYWGNGLMREALDELFRYGFNTLKLKIITAACDVRNERAISVIKKCGMSYEKTVREDCSDCCYFDIYKKVNRELPYAIRTPDLQLTEVDDWSPE